MVAFDDGHPQYQIGTRGEDRYPKTGHQAAGVVTIVTAEPVAAELHFEFTAHGIIEHVGYRKGIGTEIGWRNVRFCSSVGMAQCGLCKGVKGEKGP